MKTSYDIYSILMDTCAELRKKAQESKAQADSCREGSPDMETVAKFVRAGSEAQAYDGMADVCKGYAGEIIKLHIRGDEDPVKLASLLHAPAKDCVSKLIYHKHEGAVSIHSEDPMDAPINFELARAYEGILSILAKRGI